MPQACGHAAFILYPSSFLSIPNPSCFLRPRRYTSPSTSSTCNSPRFIAAAKSATPWPATGPGAVAPPTSLGARKTWTSSIVPGVQQAAQHAAAAFHQNVGHVPAAQFGQQGVEPGRMGVAWANQYFAACLTQPPAIGCVRFVADGHQHGRLAARADQLALRRERGAACPARYGAAVRGPGRAGRSAADRRGGPSPGRRAPHPPARGGAWTISRDCGPEIQRLWPVRVAILPSSVMAHLAMIQGRPSGAVSDRGR